MIAKERVKDKNNPDEFIDNILGADSSKKKDLAKIIKEVNGLSQYFFDEDTRVKLKSDDARAKAVVKHIEIRIKNNFKGGMQEKIPQSPLSLEFNGKTLITINKKED